MENNQFYGEVLRAVRSLRGYSVPEIAARHDMSATTIYSYEIGRSRPKLKNAALLFRALNVSMSVFDRLVDEAIANGCRVSPTELAQRIIDESRSAAVAAAASRRTADLLPDAPDPDQIDDALIRMFLAMPENAELRQDLLTRAKIACFKYLTNRGGVE